MGLLENLTIFKILLYLSSTFASELPSDRTDLQFSIIPKVTCFTKDSRDTQGFECPLNSQVGVIAWDQKILRVTNGPAARNFRVRIEWIIPVKSEIAYEVSAHRRISNRECYVEPLLDANKSWTSARREGANGVFCGEPKLTILNTIPKRTNSGSLVMGQWIAHLFARPIYDYPYLLAKNSDWSRHSVISRNIGNATTQTVRLDLDGFQGVFEIDQLRFREQNLNNSTAIQSEMGLTPESSPFRFKPLPLTVRSVVDTGYTKIQWKVGQPEGDTIEARASIDQSAIVKLVFPTQTFLGWVRQDTLEPNSKRLMLVTLSNSNLQWTISPDGFITLRFLKPIHVKVYGRSDVMSHFEAGVFFQAATSGVARGFHFAPLYERYFTSTLSADKTLLTHDSTHGIFTYDNQKFLDKRIRPIPLFTVPQSNLPLSEYEFMAEDRAMLSVFPQRKDKSIFDNPIFPVAALGDPKCDPTSETAIEACKAHLDYLRNPSLQIKTVFVNGMRWNKSDQAPLTTFLKRQFKITGTLPNERLTEDTPYFLGSAEIPSTPLQPCLDSVIDVEPEFCKSTMSVSECLAHLPASQLICSRTVKTNYSAQGPWGIPTSRPDQLNALRAFMRNAQGDPSHAPMNVVLYISPQFNSSSVDDLLVNLKKLWNEDFWDTQNNKPLFSGFYFDGLREGDPLSSLKLMRGARQIVGQNGILILHLSSNMTNLSDSYAQRATYVEQYADLVALGEGDKNVYDLNFASEPNLRNVPLTQCPKEWGLMHAGRGLGSQGHLIFPELRGVDRTLTAEENWSSVTVPPARQIEAQALCGGALWAAVPAQPNSNTTANPNVSFLDKTKGSPWTLKFPSAEEKNAPTPECGYWARILNPNRRGFCP